VLDERGPHLDELDEVAVILESSAARGGEIEIGIDPLALAETRAPPGSQAIEHAVFPR